MAPAGASLNRKKKTYVAADMRVIGVALYLTGCFRLHKDGDGTKAIFFWWHPLTWVLLLVMVVPCALLGEKLMDVVPMRLSKFWKANAEQLQWVKPWTRLDSLKPFDYSRNRHRTTAVAAD